MLQINFKKIIITFLKVIFFLLLFLCFLYIGLILFSKNISPSDENTPFIKTPKLIEMSLVKPSKTLELAWTAPDMERMKTEGCVADGLLSGYNKPIIDIPIAKNSNCYYFHRAVETWLTPPNFREVREKIKEIGKIDAQYSMFIAEAIHKKSDYYFRDEKRYFNFSNMCRSNSKNFWGEHTCKPSFKKKEYRSYLRQITRDAMDSGIRVFLFGQIKHQEEDYKNHPKIDNVIREMREYAYSINMEIFIGAQTGDITRKSYLRLFDFIDGGIGLHDDGSIENGPCYSKFYKKKGDWCWPLMWHNDYKSKAYNVITYLDWNGEIGDDMNTFTRFPTKKRHETLKYLYKTLTKQNVGFMLPLITPLPKDETACHGPRKSFYSPHNDFSCPDINIINDILKK